MKKLMIAAAIVCAAVVSQAAQVKWQGTLLGVNASDVGDNGTYDASGNFAGSIKWTLTFFTAGTETSIYSTSGTFTSSTVNKFMNISAVKASTTYDYKIVFSDGVQSSLTSKTSADYDYSGAKLGTTLTGSFTTNPTGATPFTALPTSWDVSGIVAAPEPTSAMLLLLGVAGLALKRKQK